MQWRRVAFGTSYCSPPTCTPCLSKQPQPNTQSTHTGIQLSPDRPSEKAQHPIPFLRHFLLKQMPTSLMSEHSYLQQEGVNQGVSLGPKGMALPGGCC